MICRKGRVEGWSWRRERDREREEETRGLNWGEWSPLPLLLCSPQGGQTEIWDRERQWGTDKWVSQRYHEQSYTNEAYLLQAGGEERRGEERRGEERRGKERRGEERRGEERRGEERRGKERKGKERKGKERKKAQRHKDTNIQTHTDPVAYMTWRWMCNCSVFNPAMCLLSRRICITVPSTHTHNTHTHTNTTHTHKHNTHTQTQHTQHTHTHTHPLSSYVCYWASVLSSQLWTWKKQKHDHKFNIHTHVLWKVAPNIHHRPVNHMFYSSVTLTCVSDWQAPHTDEIGTAIRVSNDLKSL